MTAPAPAATDRIAAARRWHGDAWVLARGGGSAAGAALPRYGGSQAGAVLRYDLQPGASRHPQAYVRAAAALGGARYREAAAGVSVRALPAAPVRLATELRVSDNGGTAPARLRAAAYAYTELPRLRPLPGITVDAYAQGGYISGSGDTSTAFADGLVRAEAALAERPGTAIRVGASAWAGAQRGAGRLDIGPAIGVERSAGPAFLRLSAEYRIRAAGSAEPGSGPALTIAASF